MEPSDTEHQRSHDLAFTYYLDRSQPIGALTLAERPGDTDVVTFYYHDPALLESQSCAAALGLRPGVEISSEHPQHTPALHRVDDPLQTHVHLQKPRSQILPTIAALLSRHLEAAAAGKHTQQFATAWNYLHAHHKIAGLTFTNDDTSYVVNRRCVDLHERQRIDKTNFRLVEGQTSDLDRVRDSPRASLRQN